MSENIFQDRRRAERRGAAGLVGADDSRRSDRERRRNLNRHVSQRWWLEVDYLVRDIEVRRRAPGR